MLMGHGRWLWGAWGRLGWLRGHGRAVQRQQQQLLQLQQLAAAPPGSLLRQPRCPLLLLLLLLLLQGCPLQLLHCEQQMHVRAWWQGSLWQCPHPA